MTVAEGVTIRLLGGFSVEVEGRTIAASDFERRTGADLIQALALSGGHRLHREQLIDRLWPDADLSAGANRLHKACTFARRATGAPDAIVVKNEVVALFPDRPVTVDIDRVEQADGADPASVDRAIGAYVGDLLPDNPYAEWIVPARDRLRNRLLDVLVQGRRWQDVLDLDDTNEEAHVGLMQELLEAERYPLVIERFELLEQRLATELGLVPGRAAVALRDQARREAGLHEGTDGGGSGLRVLLAVTTDAGHDDRDDELVDLLRSVAAENLSLIHI